MIVRKLACLGMLVAATGCGALGSNSDPGAPRIEAGDVQLIDAFGCPGDDCTLSNGTGVYYQETGYAGVDSDFRLLITHFVNGTDAKGRPAVTIAGRYWNPPDLLFHYGGAWVDLSNAVFDTVSFKGNRWHVDSVSESGTAVTWTLTNYYITGSDLHAQTITVTGADLEQLELPVVVPSIGASPYLPNPFPMRFSLHFKSEEPPVVGRGKSQFTIHKYNLHWSDPNNADVPYCYGAIRPDGAARTYDAAVFQQGIVVHPVTGQVTADASAVTLSCFYGAPATAYWWGYDYKMAPSSLAHRHNVATLWYFGSAIQMKRAAYCGDGRYYTRAGTKIAINDARLIQQGFNTPSQIEALWTPTGASCLNPGELRHTLEEDSNKYPGRSPMYCGSVKLQGCADTLPSDLSGQPYAESIASAKQETGIMIMLPPGI
jgi:hypothetical protein